ncbi:MAG: methyltransferase family protein [Candidatus Tyrphobacter sp.]
MMRKPGSPWWYRRRSLVIFAIYFAGFALGPVALGAHASEVAPAFVWFALRAHADPATLLWCATGLTIAGFLIRLWGSAYLSASVVWNSDARDDRLIVDGPFRFIRNPLYFGNNLQALGIGAIASPYGFLFIVLGSVVFTALLAAHESGLMHARYGAVYERYRAAVPSMVPRPIPARVEGSVRGAPSFANGMRSELLTAGLALGMLGMALYGPTAMPFLGACWIGGWILQTSLRARAHARV